MPDSPAKVIIDTNLWISFLAIDSQADALITGDADLLELVHFGNTKIVTMTSFINNI